MTPARQPLDGFATGTMLVLCLCWAFQQIAIKLVAQDVAPLLQIGLRSAFAAVVLGLVLLRAEGPRFWRDGSARAGLGVGLLFALEFVFVALGLHYTTASHMAVFLYTAPIFAALGLHARVPGERLKPLQWAGVALAFAGIAAAFLGKPAPTDAAPNMLLGDFLGLLAGAAWGLTTVGIRASRLSEAPAAKTLFYQMACAAVALPLLHALMGGAPPAWTAPALYSLLFQCVAVALFSYLVWFWLLRRYLATRLSVLSFLTPLFGVGLGVALLDEPLDGHFAAGAMLVLAGITLVSAAGMLQAWWTRRQAG
ncbi:DMT family transporter [Bordetella hinzii]|uniref:EamA-like transporter family protein n=1 Tax=Bordetella hinzii OH87 BAL007II TaxID=1331262 RepID=A0ABR4R0L7_9BORD|nr:DMT family transporter [Bordetella hinzii]KCB24157.1 EamA-like transporter family protein [Bordetella hinzii OH87 BAL007II]KCB27578.1 EamA-like transporter family protein [Bordetella hinzii CA90 BAL1384]KCB40527.1 EamA-like transporter family protein [Bordetella hinzii 5132]QDJ43608.1 EamA family transporter [Bordetella hinzii]QDJ48180.1 EamA family transporter [Bordetella hinzii]